MWPPNCVVYPWLAGWFGPCPPSLQRVTAALFDQLAAGRYNVDFIEDDGVQCREVSHSIKIDVGPLVAASGVIRALHAANPSSFRLMSSDEGVGRRWRRVWAGEDPASGATMAADLFTPESLQVPIGVWERRGGAEGERGGGVACGV